MSLWLQLFEEKNLAAVTHYHQCVIAGAMHRMTANLLFHLSAERKHPLPKMLNKTDSAFLLTAL